LLVVELLVVYWGTSAMPGHVIRMNEFVTFGGRYTIIFLPVLLLGGIAFALLSRRETRHLPAVQITGAALYVFAIFLKRYSLDVMGFTHTTLFQPTGYYIPSLVEVLLGVSIMAFGVLVFTVAIKVLPMEEPEEEHGEMHEVTQPVIAAESESALEGGVV
jgi:Ni/Fe-hydrogenase subunit HybB-like protein